MQAVVEEREQVVGDHAFKDVAVGKAKTYPQAIELRTAQEGFALGLEVVGEFADEVNGTDLGKRDLFVLAIGSEEIDRIGLAKSRRI